MGKPVTKQGTRIGTIAVVALLAAWLVLFFSGRGVLVWFTQPREKVGMLKCHYFTGTGIVDRQFLFSRQGYLGREACPRTIELAK